MEWSESDETYTEIESEPVPFSDTLYGFDCPECGEKVYNTSFDPDADGPSWLYECGNCSMMYRMYVERVTIAGFEE